LFNISFNTPKEPNLQLVMQEISVLMIKKCPKVTYQNEKGKTSCKDLPAGFYTDLEG
jgi:hypothetical protein